MNCTFKLKLASAASLTLQVRHSSSNTVADWSGAAGPSLKTTAGTGAGVSWTAWAGRSVPVWGPRLSEKANQKKTQFWDRTDWSVTPQITVMSEWRGETDHIRFISFYCRSAVRDSVRSSACLDNEIRTLTDWQLTGCLLIWRLQNWSTCDWLTLDVLSLNSSIIFQLHIYRFFMIFSDTM